MFFPLLRVTISHCMNSSDSLGPFAMHSHVLTFWLFVIVELIETTSAHSGYEFVPILKESVRFHDWHHERLTGCFGALGLLDWIHGTDKEYKRYYAAKHDRSRAPLRRFA